MKKSLFIESLELFKDDFEGILKNVKNKDQLEDIRKKYLGKKSLISDLTDTFKSFSEEEKKRIGGVLQDIKQWASKKFKEAEFNLFLLSCNFPSKQFIESFDPSIVKSNFQKGQLHLYTIAGKIVTDFFSSIGFEMVEGTIIENDFFNFTALNIPENHPARDAHDTFWLYEDSLLLRTHTSCVQIKEGQKKAPPFGIVSLGEVYRNEATDASHDFMFWQLEGLYVSSDASISNLLFVMREFLRYFFNKKNLSIRTRPYHFPFVEPGIEIDCECPFCKNGCSTCKQSHWIEIAGAGMVHPKVLKHMNIEDNSIHGWAFGFGFTRLVMLKYNINDIRNLHQCIPE